MTTQVTFATFGSTIEEIDATLAATQGLVCLGVGCTWSPSSLNLLQALVETTNEIEFRDQVKVLLMQMDGSHTEALYATRNGIVIGGEGTWRAT
jgi:hypothetical protein